jgi:Xaa-Pro aminopeptidase
VGGVRLENDYVVTEKGYKGLCRLKMDMKWSTR